jgi:hypothetical protein
LNVPSVPVEVPLLNPLKVTVAPTAGSPPGINTFPDTIRDCANKVTEKNRRLTSSKTDFLISVCFLEW